MLRLLEHPRVHHGRASDHDAAHRCLRPSQLDIRTCGNIAIADDRHLHGIRHRADDLPVRQPGVALRPGATMHGDGLDPAVFETLGHLHRIDLIRIPSDPHLRRDRNRHGLHDLTRHRLQQRAVFEQRGPPIFRHHLVHGAAEVDIDEVRLLPVDDLPRRLAHPHAVCPEELHPEWALRIVKVHILPRPTVRLHDPLSGHELRHHHIRAQFLAQTAKNRVRHPGHRGQIEREGVVGKPGQHRP